MVTPSKVNVAVQGQAFESRLEVKRSIALGLLEFVRILAAEAMAKTVPRLD